MSRFSGVKLQLRSMRARMTLLFAFLVAILMLMGGGVVLHREERAAERRAKETLNVAVEMTRSELNEPDVQGLSLLKAVQDDQGEIAAGGLGLLIADSNGKVLWKSRRQVPQWPRVSDRWRIRTVSQNGQTLVIARDWSPIEDDLLDLQGALWLLGVVIVLGTALLAWFVVGQTLSPLEKLADQAQNASIDSLQVRLHSPSSDFEMNHLTATLNGLLSRLEKEAQARGRFYAAASHELRTPIQVLLGEVDVARSRERTPAEYQIVLAQVQSHTERLALLVSDLLQLNALEMRQNLAPNEPLNLLYWVERALDQQALNLRDGELNLEMHLKDADIEAPSTHVEVLFRNLVENAVKYGRSGSTIRVLLAPTEIGARFEIRNDCELAPGVDPCTWFEPFFRLDSSRSSNTGGNGMGLAICRAICTSNGWRIELLPEQDGLCARVDLVA